MGTSDVFHRSDAHAARRRALLRRGPQPVLPMELGDMGDQRGTDPLSCDRHVRRRRLGRGLDSPPRDRDPRRCSAEPQDPELPVPLVHVPLPQAVKVRAGRLVSAQLRGAKGNAGVTMRARLAAGCSEAGVDSAVVLASLAQRLAGRVVVPSSNIQELVLWLAAACWAGGSAVARSGEGTSAAPAITRQKASTRALIPTAPDPIGSPKTRMPPRIAERLAATDVIAITSIARPICRLRAEA